MKFQLIRSALLSSAVCVQATPLSAATVDIAKGTTETSQQSVGGTDQLTVEQGGALSVDDTAIKWNSASTDLRITNDGLIESTDDGGRAINAGGSDTAPRTLTLTNNAGAIIRSQSDAIRINVDITGGTVKLINSGTILSSGDGQAIDFDEISSAPDGAVEIDNLAGGIIQSTDADALRPGQGAIVNNSGTIYAGATSNDSSDGIDLQSHSGTIHNYAGGLISGARHGITTDSDVTVINDAGATIIGRNGSGIGSDGSATVTNYGTIIGAYDGSGSGDGDGIDLDNGGIIDNYGVIKALGAAGVHSSDGHPNSSDGATIGGVGGTVINHAGALIYSTGVAVPITMGTVINDGTITSGSAGVLYATGSGKLTNTGIITGAAIGALGSASADVFTNSGTISSPAVAIDLGGGDDQLILLPGSVLEGSVNGGDGHDQVILSGDGDGSFAGAVNFEHLAVASGDWTLTGASTFTDGTAIAAGASLTGSADVLAGAIDNEGTLKVDQAADGVFSATLAGDGQLIKAGVGALTIGDQAFTGATRVAGGTLLVEGVLPSSVAVASGATLGGTGSIAGLTVETGGTVASGPGGDGALTINGDLVQQAGSTLLVNVAAGQTGASLSVGGTVTVAPGAVITLAQGADSQTIGSRFVLVSAGGGISGSYTVHVAPDADTELRLVNGANEIDGVVARTGGSLVRMAATRNQAAVAPALAAAGAANAAFAQLTLDPSDDEVRTALSALSGDIHASVHTAMVHDALLMENAAQARLNEIDTELRSAIWGQFSGEHGRDEGADGASGVTRNSFGGIGGIDVPLGEEARAGIAGGYTRTRMRPSDGASRATARAGHVMAYAGGNFGMLQVRAGLGYDWSKIRTRRNLAFAGFSDQDHATYHGHAAHGFGEIGYALTAGPAAITPFVRATMVHAHTGGFAEAGGAAALEGEAGGETAKFSDLGGRIALPLSDSVRLRATATWQHAYGAIRSHARLAFLGAADGFDVVGTALSRDAVRPTLDLAWRPSTNVTISLGYAGRYGANGNESGGRIGIGVNF